MDDIDAVVVGKAPRLLRRRDDARVVHGRRGGRHRQAVDPGAHRQFGRRVDRVSWPPAWSSPVSTRRVLAMTWEKQSESNAMWALSSVPFTKPVGAGAGGYFAPHVRAYIRRSGAPTRIAAGGGRGPPQRC